MSEATIEDVDIDIEEEIPSEYTSETPARAVVTRDIVVAPAGATGRRKQAIARVRIVPGTGKWTINGRELAFPVKPAHFASELLEPSTKLIATATVLH